MRGDGSRRFLTTSLLAAKAAPLMVGGQAVMEGVLMKSRHHTATAVRKSSGKIVVHHRREVSFAERTGIGRIPLLRGVFILFETLIVGIRELNWSANQAADEEEQLSTTELVLTLALSIIFALTLFKLLPLFLATLLTSWLGGGSVMLSLFDGAIKFLIFVLYLAIIALLPDVRRLFQYHGAEHKSVNCYEANVPLTPKNAKRFTAKQARCGTTFMVYVFALSILLYLFIPFSYGFWANFGLRIALLPVIAGIVYEWTRFSGKFFSRSVCIRVLSAPGMAFQKLTLREPDEKQLEVAIAALKRVLVEEKKTQKKAA